MLFPTIDFAIFFAIVFTANWLTMPHPKVWRWVMLGASYFFYGYWNWRFVPLLILSSLVNQALAVRIHRSPSETTRKWLLGTAVAANLSVLAVFKYYGFFVSSVVNGLNRLGVEANLPLLQFLLPVGISFFTFQALSYVIDIYRGHARPYPLLDFSVYLAFFPQLVAGPIVRSTELLPQFASPRDPRRLDASRGFYLIFVGLVKKVVIADFLARQIVDPVFAAPGQHSGLEALGAIYGFSVQIYCDFSAYSDIAIGVALLLGFRLPDNFDRPYIADTIQDFWRRWHISLSRWLRDYLYVPLGGSRGASTTTYRNLMITMLLGGLWHGADWRFVLWGGAHGVWLAAGRFRRERKGALIPSGLGARLWGGATTEPPRASGWELARRRLVTFHLVTLLWVPFRADSLGHAWDVVVRVFSGWGPSPAVTPAVLAAIVVGVGAQYVPSRWPETVQTSFSQLRPLAQGAALAAALVAIDALGPEGVAAFIYFQF